MECPSSALDLYGPVAQLVERCPEEAGVESSNLSGTTKDLFLYSSAVERCTVNALVGGSIPSRGAKLGRSKDDSPVCLMVRRPPD